LFVKPTVRMGVAHKVPLLLGEISEFLASAPSQDELLKYRPSEQLQKRAKELLARLKDDGLTAEEERELDQFEWIDSLFGLIQARIRARQMGQP
jgi:hypothetical protein